MMVAGIDVGSLSSKAVILEDNKIKAWGLLETGPDSEKSSCLAMELALKNGNLTFKDLAFVVATGYGRVNAPFAQATMTEISCHARGNHWFFPRVHTVLDMGGQDCKAIRCDDAGNVINFVMNDRCAAGTGRYLERIADDLELKLEDIGLLSLNTVENPLPVSESCAVFAESDVINYAHEGKPFNDILAGVSDALVIRIKSMFERVGIQEELCISGGIAKNIGIVSRLEKHLGLKARIAKEPQIVGALGAALFAADRMNEH